MYMEQTQVQTNVFTVYIEMLPDTIYRTNIVYVDTEDYLITKALYYYFKSIVDVFTPLYYNIEVANGPPIEALPTYAHYTFIDDFEVTEDIVKACTFTVKSHVLDLLILENANSISGKPYTTLLNSSSSTSTSTLTVICLNTISKDSIKRLSELKGVKNVQLKSLATLSIDDDIRNIVDLLQIQVQLPVDTDIYRHLIMEVGNDIDLTRLLYQYPNVLNPTFYESNLKPLPSYDIVYIGKETKKQLIDFVSSNGYQFVTVGNFMNYQIHYFYNPNNGKFCTLFNELDYIVTNDPVLKRLCMEW